MEEVEVEVIEDRGDVGGFEGAAVELSLLLVLVHYIISMIKYYYALHQVGYGSSHTS